MDTQLRELDRATGRAGLQVFWVWERRLDDQNEWAPLTAWKRLAGPFMFRVEAEQLLKERVKTSTWAHQCVLVEGDGKPVMPEEVEE